MAWVRYMKHRQATPEEWAKSDARKWSKEEASQYNPTIYGTDDAIRELEGRALRDGITISQTQHRRTVYLRVANTIVGACSGELTEYVFVEVTSGEYHGRPISEKALKVLGVKL